MFIGGKFARPVAARKFVHQQSLENKLHKRSIVIKAPAGSFLSESLSALLEDNTRLVVWLRFSPEDFDPGVCLFSLIAAFQGVDQRIGENTLLKMRQPPGPVQGWPKLYKQLAHELGESLTDPTTIVLEDLHLLNRYPQTLLLLSRHFLELLPKSTHIVLVTQEHLPLNMILEEPAFVNLHDLKLPQQAIDRLMDENNISLSTDQLRHAGNMVDGSVEGLIGLFRMGQFFGTQYLHQILKGVNYQFEILNRIVYDWLGALDEQDVLSMTILCSLGYNHPEINQAIIGKRMLPLAPWEQELSQKWIRSCNLWRRPLRYALQNAHLFDQQTTYLVAEHLSQHDSSIDAFRLFLNIRAYQQAARHLERNAFEMMNLGQWELLRHWLAVLPDDVIRDRAWLLYASGEIKTAEGDIDAARKAFRRASEQFAWEHDNLGACTSLLASSALANKRGDFKEAYVSALQASRIAQASSLPLQEAWAEFQLGYLSVRESDAQIATYHFEQASEIASKSSDTGTQEYFSHMHSLALARQDQQHERKIQYRRYREMLRTERGYNERLQVAVQNPTESSMVNLAAQNWLHLPLMLKYSGQIQLGEKNKFNRVRIAWQRIMERNWRIPGYRLVLWLRAILDRYLAPVQPISFQDNKLQTANPIRTKLVDEAASEERFPVLPSGNVDRSISKETNSQETIKQGNGKQKRVTLVVYLLGSFKLSVDDVLLEHIPGGNSGVLLKYLIHNRKRSVPREELLELFWPDADPETSRNRLNVIMSKVRKAIRNITDYEIILYENDMYFLNPELSFWADVDEFEDTIAVATQVDNVGDSAHAVSLLEIAANLYQGDYMQEDIYEEWTVLLRERLRLANLDARYRLSRHYFEQRQYAACASLCQSILEHDNCREDVHCLLMRCYARQGQYHLGLRQYQYCVDILRKELDVKPADSTIALYERLRRREITQPLSMT